MLPAIRNSADAPSARPPASMLKVSLRTGSAAGMPNSSPVVALMYEPSFTVTDLTGQPGARLLISRLLTARPGVKTPSP